MFSESKEKDRLFEMEVSVISYFQKLNLIKTIPVYISEDVYMASVPLFS